MSGARSWHWVRHGPTHAKAMIGWTDLPADLGDTAALARLAAALPAGAPVVSSDLARTRATADALAGDRPRLAHRPGLREIHFGAWEGRTHAEIEAEDPETIFAFWDRPGTVAPPGGESWDAFRARVEAEIDALEATAPPGPIIAVAHFGVILVALQRALGLATTEVFAHRIEPLSLTVIAGDRAGPINHRP